MTTDTATLTAADPTLDPLQLFLDGIAKTPLLTADEEITADVADSERSVIVEQVTNGVAVRMAVLYLLLGGSEPANTDNSLGHEGADA